jgi:3-hydroxyisobutyrate dehydrogenase-like beta-hydroxyacid dehydrogenase
VAATVRGTDVVFVVVLTDEQVRSVCLGRDGTVAAMKPASTAYERAHRASRAHATFRNRTRRRELYVEHSSD